MQLAVSWVVVSWLGLVSSQTNVLVPSGIQSDIAVGSLAGASCHVCYDQPYSHSTTESDIETCKSARGADTWLAMGAKSSSGASSYTRLAYIKDSDFVIDTESISTAYYSNGAYWYYFPGRGLGFAPSSTADLSNADIHNRDSGDCALRLSWHMTGAGGWRVGCIVSLYDTTWRKVIQSCVLAPCPAGT